MTTPSTAHPPVVDRAAWEEQRQGLLVLEKAATRLSDAVAAQRRRQPMTPVEDYTFDGEGGPLRFSEMFAGRPQLVVQHFMFAPEWEKGCPHCTGFADSARPSLPALARAGITFARISRAPIGKLLAYSRERGWDVPWYSAHANTFNQDWGWSDERGEGQGVSAYLLVDGQPYLTYSTGGRGVEQFSSFFAFLDIAPYGRQEKWQDAPPGWPQK